MKNAFAKVLVMAWLLCAAAVASAFTPAGGLWGFTDELNGQPGRGFQLTVENDVLVFYYYGYDSDGGGNYLFAAGPLTAGSFNADLVACRGGTVIGAPYKAATCSNATGRVSMTFTSGERGTITMPGETAKPINRFNFGYGNGPDALLGEFMFAYKGNTTSFSEFYTLTRKTGTSTNYGNGSGTGVVVNADNTFSCEYAAVANVWRDIYLCTELAGSEYDDIFVFRMVGDRGTGIGTWVSASSTYPLQVLRTATSRLTRTGPYDEAESVLTRPKALEIVSREKSTDTSIGAKQLEQQEGGTQSLLSPQEDAYFMEWAAALRALVRDQIPLK